jgi:hypothetical protein
MPIQKCIYTLILPVELAYYYLAITSSKIIRVSSFTQKSYNHIQHILFNTDPTRLQYLHQNRHACDSDHAHGNGAVRFISVGEISIANPLLCLTQ